MKYIKTLNELITEKKVSYKRKYTENYPEKIVSTSARVRNAIFDAMQDGIITEDELNRILSEIKANKNWIKRNADLFKLEEDSDGCIIYKMSIKGNRIFKVTKK